MKPLQSFSTSKEWTLSPDETTDDTLSSTQLMKPDFVRSLSAFSYLFCAIGAGLQAAAVWFKAPVPAPGFGSALALLICGILAQQLALGQAWSITNKKREKSRNDLCRQSVQWDSDTCR